jgi:signal transduction histidine kinase
MSCTILLVDDDPDFKRILEARLRAFLKNLSVVSYARLQDARAFLLQERGKIQFDLVILDQHLPDGRGTDLLQENFFIDYAVLCLSSDTDPTLPGQTILAGANYFLNKINISEPLFRPLVEALIERNQIHRELSRIRTQSAVMESVRTLVMTLKHEINNPLGAILGGAFLLHSGAQASEKQKQAAQLVEQSGQRIKTVLDQLCSAISLETVTKGGQVVYQVPGDAPWEGPKSES